MKILFLNQVFYPDGAATAQHTSDLSLYLTKIGCDVTVITGRRDYNDRKKIYSKTEDYHGVKVIRVGSTGFGKKNFFYRLIDALTFDLSLIGALFRLPRQDVVIAFTSPPLIGFIGALFCTLRGGKLVSWMMDLNPATATAVGFLKKGSGMERFLNAVFEFSLKRSEKIVVLDRWMKKKIEEHAVPSDRIVVIPPWPVHPITPSPALRSNNPFREKFRLENKFVVLYSGNHSVVHPLNTLIEAAIRLRERSDVQFIFVGGGLRVDDVKKAKETYQLSNVLQLPHQPRELLDASLSMADLHVVVMGKEVSGLVHTSKIYGILATGTPYVVIGPSQSHLSDLLADCPGGFHVEHGQVDELVGAIETAQSLPPETLQEYAQKNIDFLHRHYTAEISLTAFAEKVLALPPTRIPLAPTNLQKIVPI